MDKAKISFNHMRYIIPEDVEATKPGPTLSNTERNYSGHYKYANFTFNPTIMNDGNTIFVNGVSGSDGNPGTQASPVKTINYAISLVNSFIGKLYIGLLNYTCTQRVTIDRLTMASTPIIISSVQSVIAKIESPNTYDAPNPSAILTNRVLGQVWQWAGVATSPNASHVGKGDEYVINVGAVDQIAYFLPNLGQNSAGQNTFRQSIVYDGRQLYTSSLIPLNRIIKTCQKNPYRTDSVEILLQRYDIYTFAVSPSEAEFNQLFLSTRSIPFANWAAPRVDIPIQTARSGYIRFIVDICRNNKHLYSHIAVVTEKKNDNSKEFLTFHYCKRSKYITASQEVDWFQFFEIEDPVVTFCTINTIVQTVKCFPETTSLWSANNFYYLVRGIYTWYIDQSGNVNELTQFFGITGEIVYKVIYHELSKKYYLVSNKDCYLSEDGINFASLSILNNDEIPINISTVNHVIFMQTVPSNMSFSWFPVPTNNRNLYYSFDGIKWFHDYQIPETHYGGIYENNGRVLLLAGSHDYTGLWTNHPAIRSFQEALINVENVDPKYQHAIDNVQIDCRNRCGMAFTEGNKVRRA